MIEDQLVSHEAMKLAADEEDRTTRKRIEAMKEKLAARLEAIKDRRDDMLTIEEIGIDQVIVDEAQEFRKLSFATNRTTLKGVDPDGSQRSWDLFVKARYLDHEEPRPCADPGLGHAHHQHARRDVHRPALPGRGRAARARRPRVRRLGVGLRRHPHRTGAAAVRRLQAGRAVLRLHQRARADRHVPLGRRRRPERRSAWLPQAAAGPRRAAPARHVVGQRWFQGLSEAPGAADRGDPAAHAERCSRATTSCSPSSPTAATPRSTCGWSGPATTTSRRTS